MKKLLILLTLVLMMGCAGHIKNKICWLCKGRGGYCMIHSSERQSECPWPTHPKCPNCGKVYKEKQGAK